MYLEGVSKSTRPLFLLFSKYYIAYYLVVVILANRVWHQ